MGLVTPFYSSQGWRIGVDGDNPTTGPTVMMDAVDSAYFHVVGTGVMRGRGFDPSDYQTGDAMLVNERFARRFFGTTDALGRCVRLALSTRPCIHVVGVVRNSKYMSLRESPQPFFYLPLTARWEWTPLRAIYARTTHDATATAAELRRTLPMVSPYAVDISVQSFREILRDQLAPARLRMTICVVFAGVALIIAMIGTYAVVAYSIERRMREVGVRLALGASPRDIRHLIVEFALRHAIVGLLLGLTVGFLVNTLLAHFLYAVAPSDIEAFGGAMGVVVVGSIVASIIPAWRASRADPVAILRSE
jgi:predicted lysophospholipase L1 biosynthesis ABC-type transport system permease subunit